MKPNFAISFSFDGIRLLHRVPGGWHLVGEAAFDTEDLAGELTMLRRTAQVLDPSGIRSKILIPNEQIKFLTLDSPDASDEDIRAALDGTTPYALDELAIDSSRDGEATYVAAVARETLDEALDFARQHRFQPTCFAAVPERGSFLGEVFFGATDPQATVERDKEAVAVIGTAKSPLPDLTAEAEKPEGEAAEEDDGDGSEIDSEMPLDFEEVAAGADTVTETDRSSEALDPQAADGGDNAPVFSSRTKPLRADFDVPQAVKAAPSAPLREVAGEPVFASRGRQEPPLAGKPDGKKTGNMPPLPSALQSASASLDPADDIDDDIAGDPKEENTGGKPELRTILAVGATQTEEEGQKASGRRSPLSKVTDPSPGQSESPEKTGASGRYLWLILTAILLVFLAAVGIWASVTDTSLSRLIFGPGDAVVELAAEDPAADAPSEGSPSISEEELSDLADIADLPPDNAPPPEGTPSEEIAAVSETVDTGTAEAVSLPAVLNPTILSPAEAERVYAATGVWLRAPRLPLTPRTESSDTIFLAAIDPSIGGSDAIALPDLLRSGRDVPLEAQPLPPPPGTIYQRDAEGFILATAEGTLLPSGIVVTAGAPALVPPRRPIFEIAGQGAETAPGEEAVASQEVNATADPALAGKTPKSRPAALAETIERASLGGRTLDELSGIRPRPRPEGLVVAEAPADAIAEALAAVAGDPFADATELAVASSERPQGRPRNFDRVVAAASTAPTPTAAPAIVQGTSGPVPRSVAEAATENSVLELRELALVGLMGSANDRRAMIRTAFGRILLVRVGDELDGGRVTSIGDNALTYTKRGRTYTLEMPSG